MKDPELEYYGKTKGGVITLPSDKIRREIAAALPDCEIEVRFRQKRKRRSIQENNYYWACIVAAFVAAFRDWDTETGWTAGMVHEYLKLKFLPLVREWGQLVVPSTGEVIDAPMTTTKLTTVEAETYYEYCRKHGAEMDILIALPNEQMSIWQEVVT